MQQVEIFCSACGQYGYPKQPLNAYVADNRRLLYGYPWWGVGMKIEAKLADMGLVLPAESKVPPGTAVPPYWIRVRNNVAYVSGQAPRNADGSPAGPFGKVPSEVSLDEAREAARGCALSILDTLQRELGDLDRISAWLSVTGMVNADVGFTETSAVTNGFSEFIVELFGPEIGAHARTSPGMAALPGNSAVVIAAIVEIDGH